MLRSGNFSDACGRDAVVQVDELGYPVAEIRSGRANARTKCRSDSDDDGWNGVVSCRFASRR